MAREESIALEEQVLALPRKKKEALLEALQANLAPMPDWHRQVLEERIALANANPDTFTSAPEVVERIRAGLRRR